MNLRLGLLLAALPLLAPGPAALAEDPASAPPKVVHLETRDGLSIEADWYPGGRGMPGIVGLHMYPADRTSWKPLAQKRPAGFHFLALDMRGYGGSRMQGGIDLAPRVKDRDPTLFNAMWQDAQAGVEFLRGEAKCDPKRIGLVGASVGCSVAIDTAVRDGKIAGVAVLTPGKAYMQVPTMDHVRSWGETPLLLLSSEKEADGGARPIAAELKAKPGVELRIVPGTEIHGTTMFGKVAGIEERIADWLEAVLGAEILDGVADLMETTGGTGGRVCSEEIVDDPGEGTRIRSDLRGLNLCIRVSEEGKARQAFVLDLQAGPGGSFGEGALRLRGRAGGEGTLQEAWLDTWKDGKWSEKPLGNRPGMAIAREACLEIRMPWSLVGIPGGGKVRVGTPMFLGTGGRPGPRPGLVNAVLEVPE